MEEEINGELAFLDTLLKRNNVKISVMVYRKPTNTDQYLHYSSYHQLSCKKNVYSLLNRAHSIITDKDYLTKENTKIKQVLKENGYQKALLEKILRKLLTITAWLSHNNKSKARIFKRNEFKLTVRWRY